MHRYYQAHTTGIPNDFYNKKKSPEKLRDGVLCHKRTVYKQFSTHKFINTQKKKKEKKKKQQKPDFWPQLS